jgi:hypothetical protein
MRRHHGLVTIDTGTPIEFAPPGTADGIIRFDKPPTEAEYERFRAIWEQRHAGAAMARTVLLAEPAAITRGCAHTDTEPVELVTGEVVAAVCVDCLAALPAAWLDCDHDAPIDITCFGQRPGSQLLCNGCGGTYSPP